MRLPGKPRAPPNESQSHLVLSDILRPHGLVLRARFLEWVAFSLLQGFTGGSEEKYLPAMWETWVQSLGQQDPLGKEMATHSSTLAWEIPWMEEPGSLQSMESQKVRNDWTTSLSRVNFDDSMRHPAQGATGVWVMLGLIFNWFPLC